MTTLAAVRFVPVDPDAIATAEGVVAVPLPAEGALPAEARRLDRLTKGAVKRAVGSAAFGKLGQGEVMDIAFPAGLAATSAAIVKLDRKPGRDRAMAAGAALAKLRGDRALLILAGGHAAAADLALGAALRGYSFADHKTGDAPEPPADIAVTAKDPEAADAAFADARAAAEGVFLCRDLVNEPANVLTTTEFAARLEAMRDLGLEVEVLEEAELERLGMRTLLAVGQGSESPSKVVVMQWKGGGEEKPLALVGKGVVFDTGGVSLKPAAGMEDMTMDMGGAGVVAGVMRALALRKAKANVVGVVGLVENMPGGDAQRPGDIVTSMKGDTVEVINTDAEGRLVLADALWYTQEMFKPRGVIDLATLTGAVIIALGHHNAGYFANDDAFAAQFEAACKATGEPAWRLPLGEAYDRQLKSRLADMKNVGGRQGGSITAAQFLQRFIKDGVPWIHIDIAGVTLLKEGSHYAPAGATGWGVRALDHLIRETAEG
jgi:leucyl aminopeptidase